MPFSLPTPTFAFYHRLNSRERVLLLIVGGSVAFIVNLILLSVLLRNSRELGQQYTEKTQELDRENLFAAQKAALWTPRNDWLKKTQPVLDKPGLAGSQLLEIVQGIARGNGVIVTNPRIVGANGSTPTNPGGGNADYQPVSVRIDTQSDWKNVVRFVAAVQQPNAFLVFEEGDLSSDRSDPATMHGTFLISKWYAPGGKGAK